MQLASATPYLVKGSDLFKITAKYKKHGIKSAAYKKDLEQVQKSGIANSTDRAAYNTASARFWADGAGKTLDSAVQQHVQTCSNGVDCIAHYGTGMWTKHCSSEYR